MPTPTVAAYIRANPADVVSRCCCSYSYDLLAARLLRPTLCLAAIAPEAVRRHLTDGYIYLLQAYG